MADDGCAALLGTWGPFPPLAVTQRAQEGTGLRIVALGSSSTAGAGASTPGAAYPAMLQRRLAARFPELAVELVNAGVGGDTVADNLTRLERDVLAVRPDLVIWQVGTNDALLGIDPATVRAGLEDGISRLRAAGAEVVLMDGQFRPAHPEDAAARAVRAAVRDAAAAAGVGLLGRFELMRGWLAGGRFTAATILHADGLHMNDASYACLAERVADLFPPVH